MRPLNRLADPISDAAAAIVARGYHVSANLFDSALVSALQAEARELWDREHYRPARVGSGDAVRLASAIRSDRIHWLDETSYTPAQYDYAAVLEELRLEINRRAFIGLFEWEGHFACYPSGAYYRRHLDVFADAKERQITTLLYLNDNWKPGDGGELRLWTEPAGPDWTTDSPSVLVEPRAGTFVTFLSEDYFHEVQVSRRERFSLTGWFRIRG